MSVIVAYVLTALGALAIGLTHLRLRNSHSGWPLKVHTVAGVLAVALWLLFLVSHGGWLLDETSRNLVGVVALAFWWAVAATGLILLVRWMPSRRRGKRAATTVDAADSWTDTPWLSIVAHVGTLVGVVWFTWAYAISAI